MRSLIFLRNSRNSIGTSRGGVESRNANEIALKPGLRIGVDLVDPGQFLQLLLDAVGDLVLHFLGRRARPDRADDGDLDGEGGILGAPEPLIGEGAAEADGENQEGDQLGMADRPLRQIDLAHHSPARLSTTRTFSLASSL